ncbi:MAG: DUF5916 domain-containing protein [Bacteroidota bacterium]
MKEITLIVAFVVANLLAIAQTTTPEMKSMQALRTELKPKIDANLSEIDWEKAKPTNGLTTLQPVFGNEARFESDIRIIYDNTAIYLGATLFDPAPDSIPTELRQRDQIGNADWFGIFLSPYQDGINGVSFIVSSAGVQFDARYSTFGEDENWDAVWESAVKITQQGWVVEMRIPYSALRFPKQEIQNWDINFGRLIQRFGEKSFWSPIDPQQDGFLNQFGTITGIKNIESPVRLSATPFIVGYAQNNLDKDGETTSTWGQSFNAGMDVKYGINDAYTLDMTLIPDFGEARSDNQVLNLSPFEQRFDENRQFFTEGVELFNKGGLFYSRRIGGRTLNSHLVEDQLQEGEAIIANPQQAQLLNASKVSGRSTNGLGIGVFNAIEARSFATVKNGEGIEREIQTHPLTNYSVVALDQNLKNNSFATLINTNVTRFGDDYDANVTGAVFELRNKANSYSISGDGALSQKSFADADTEFGHAISLRAGKTNGYWQWRVGFNEESDTYDINDLGFIFNNNEQSFWGNIRYNRYEPLGPFNSMGGGMYVQHERLYNPNKAAESGVNFWWWGQTKNLWRWNIFTYFTPNESIDFFGPRTEGMFYRHPRFANTGFWMASDRRKQFSFELNGGVRTVNEKDRHNLWGSTELNYRMSDQFSAGLESYHEWEMKDVDFATFDNDLPIYGQRDVFTFVNTLRWRYTMNVNMGLTFRLRHYWSRVQYHEFYDLGKNGNVTTNTSYNGNLDTSFDAFTIDCIYRWRFAPGSDIFFIWKNSIFDQENSFAQANYFNHLGNLFGKSQTNSFSLKVIYFLDYLDVVKK